MAEAEALAALDDSVGSEVEVVDAAEELECLFVFDAFGDDVGTGLAGESRHCEEDGCCVRLDNGAMRWLVVRIGPGVPVAITS